MSPPNVRGIGILALMVLGSTTCDRGSEGPEASALARARAEASGPWNVLLISIDTLRPDHLGIYGYPKPTSPNLDRIAAESVVYEQAIAQAPSTLPSHASMLTSLVPSRHGASLATRTPLKASVPTLTELLAERGYRTAAIQAGRQLAPEFGLGRGFERYELVDALFSDTVASACTWLADERDPRPFFLFLHTYEVHHPYRPSPGHLAQVAGDYHGALPDQIEIEAHLRRINGSRTPKLEIDEADLAHIVSTYDAEIRSMDGALGQLEACLRATDVWDSTLLVFTSDHGEEFGEHGMVGWHSHTLYDELLRVPLIVRFPGALFAGTRVTELVRGIDLTPTVLDGLGLPAPSHFQGRSMIARAAPPSAAAPAPAPLAVSEIDTPSRRPGTAAARTPRWKLVGPQLFDLESDPGERVNVAADFPDVVRALGAALTDALGPTPESEAAAISLSPDLEASLRQLGYLE